MGDRDDCDRGQLVSESTEVEEIALIDLSSIAHPIFYRSANEPDPDWTARTIVERVRALTLQHPKAAICCDGPRSFRNDLDDTYKANRPDRSEVLKHQILAAREQLADEGFPVWYAEGFEADDLIASACEVARGVAETSVLVISEDKDLFQLVEDGRVRVLRPSNGVSFDVAAVVSKFNVRPDQMRDFLCLVGDSSDNVKGATKVGPVTASKLLGFYGNLEGALAAASNPAEKMTDALRASLVEFSGRADLVCQLITLRTDAPIPFAELDADRKNRYARESQAAEMPIDGGNMTDEQTGSVEAERELTADEASAAAAKAFGDAVKRVDQIEAKPDAATSEAPDLKTPSPAVQEPRIVSGVVEGSAVPSKPQQGATKAVPDRIPAAESGAMVPIEYERQLDPKSLTQAEALAQRFFVAQMFTGYGSPQAVLSTIIAGRELGLTAVASLRAFHNIEGKHSLAADAMRALVIKSGKARYFRIVERTAQICTWETLRDGDADPVQLSYSIPQARAAFGFYDGMSDATRKELEGKWARSSWGKHPEDMLSARASSKLARLVYSDILFGLYSPEELRD